MLGELGSGGMATVHLGKLLGDAGFHREVAIKRLQPRYAADPEFVAMLLDEARIVSRVRHPHVVQVLDVVSDPTGVYLVMEFVYGETLSWLMHAHRKRSQPLESAIAVAVAIDALRGLHAAHTAVDEAGQPLLIVHRDVSPHNIIVGADGMARVLDFGVAKAIGRSSATQDGQIKGKVAYMAPEQVTGKPVDGRSDLYALGIVLWEALSGRRLFEADSQLDLMRMASAGVAPELLRLATVNPGLHAVLRAALAKEPEQRFASAQQMADALEALGLGAQREQTANLVKSLAAERLSGVCEILNRSVGPGAAPLETTGSAIALDVPLGEAVSSSTLSAPLTRERGPTRRRWAIWAAGVAGVAGFAAAIGWTGRQADSVAVAPPALSEVAVVRGPEPEPELLQPSPEKAVAPPAGQPARSRVRSAKPLKPASARKPAEAIDPCTPAYELDAEGNPRFKRECLHP